VKKKSTEVVPATPAGGDDGRAVPALLVGAESAGRDLVNQLLGQAQALSAAGSLLRTFGVTKLAMVKENKLYQQLKGVRAPNGSELSGTWQEFCGLLGMSDDKANEDIANVRAFGESALEQMHRAGIGYRELRKFRRLPDDEHQALIEVAKDGDKDALLDLAESIIARHSKEKETLQEQVGDLQASLNDADVKLETAEAELEAAEKKLKKSPAERADKVPVVVAELRAEIAAQAKAAQLAISEFQGIGEDVVGLGAAGAHDWADGTLRLAVAGLSALRLQLDGLLAKFLRELPDGTEPTLHSSFTPQEAAEAAERYAALTGAHSYAKELRQHEREQALPRGKGRPKAAPKAPKGGA
jgi:hypothetical protein